MLEFIINICFVFLDIQRHMNDFKKKNRSLSKTFSIMTVFTTASFAQVIFPDTLKRKYYDNE